MERILIIGSGGSGKSTLAKRLGEKSGLPVVHLDRHFWGPGWRAPSSQEWQRTVGGLLAADRWIMDGNYGGTMEQRLDACDTVVFLDVPRLVCLWRLLGRRIRYRGRARPEMTEGCPERLTLEFLHYVWMYPRTRRPRILERLASLGEGKNAVVLRSNAEVDAFVTSFGAAA